MKKFAGIALAILATASLAACGDGGSAEGRKSAVEKTLNASICALAASGNPLMAGVESELSGTTNDALLCTVQQTTTVDGHKYTVDLTWTWGDEFKDIISLVDLQDDPTHKKMEFVYPAHESDPISISFKANATCGEETGEATFLAKLTPSDLVFDAMTIAQIYETNDAGNNFKIIGTDGKITPNHGQRYLYAAVSGKLIYKAPDENWGLLADGSNVVELYRIDACSDKDKFVVGNYLTVYCEVSNGYGNIQLAFISKAEEMTDHSAIAEPTEHVLMKAGVNDSASTDYVEFFENNYMNSLGYIQGTYVPGPGAFTPGARYTFGIKVDETHTITVAYDYHVAKGDDAVGNAYSAILGSATTETVLHIKGTIRWSTDDGTHTIGGPGAWTITPYLIGDIAVIS